MLLVVWRFVKQRVISEFVMNMCWKVEFLEQKGCKMLAMAVHWCAAQSRHWERNIRSWNMQNAWQIAPYLAKLQENWRFLYAKRNIIYPLHARSKILAGLLAFAHSFCQAACLLVPFWPPSNARPPASLLNITTCFHIVSFRLILSRM